MKFGIIFRVVLVFLVGILLIKLVGSAFFALATLGAAAAAGSLVTLLWQHSAGKPRSSLLVTLTVIFCCLALIMAVATSTFLSLLGFLIGYLAALKISKKS